MPNIGYNRMTFQQVKNKVEKLRIKAIDPTNPNREQDLRELISAEKWLTVKERDSIKDKKEITQKVKDFHTRLDAMFKQPYSQELVNNFTKDLRLFIQNKA